MRKITFWAGIMLVFILIVPSTVAAKAKVMGVSDTEVVERSG